MIELPEGGSLRCNVPTALVIPAVVVLRPYVDQRQTSMMKEIQ